MTRRLLALTFVLSLLGADAEVRARDLSGRLGLGGHVDGDPFAQSPSFKPALSLKYWVSDFGLQALFSMVVQTSTEDVPGLLELRPAARVLYAMTRARATNLYVGAGLSSVFRSDVDDDNEAYLDLVLGAEHFFGERLSVAGHVTVSVELGSSSDRDVGSSAWGGSFHYYF